MRELTLDDQQIFNQYLASSHRHWQFQPEFITIPDRVRLEVIRKYEDELKPYLQ